MGRADKSGTFLAEAGPARTGPSRREKTLIVDILCILAVYLSGRMGLLDRSLRW